MPKTVVAIPCYRCAPQIGRVLAGFDEALLARVDEVLVIDNQSPDDTVERALDAVEKLGSPKVRVVRNLENYGLGGSQKAAFSHAIEAGADWVAILHGDAQATTSELHILLDAAKEDPDASAHLGSRFMSGSRLDGYSPTRIAGNVGLNLLYSLLSMHPVKDLGSGLNLFRTADLKADARWMECSDKMTFNLDLLLHYLSLGARLEFHPITWTETDQVSNARNLQIGWTALTNLLAWRIGAANRHAPRPDGYPFEDARQASGSRGAAP